MIIDIILDASLFSVLHFCCPGEWALSERTRQLFNTFFFKTQGIVVKDARNKFEIVQWKRPQTCNAVGKNLLTTPPFLRSVLYIVFELFVEAFHAKFIEVCVEPRHVVHQYGGRYLDRKFTLQWKCLLFAHKIKYMLMYLKGSNCWNS